VHVSFAVAALMSNSFGWRSYLGELYGTERVPYTAAPARAQLFTEAAVVKQAVRDRDEWLGRQVRGGRQ